jgi:predicted Fe-S protein YdhL (DUF1289 family)
VKFFYRDGREHTTDQVCNWNREKQQGKVYILNLCSGCHGKGQRAHEGFSSRCGVCYGTGRARTRTWVNVYSQERLDQLNAEPEATTKQKVKEIKSAFTLFVEERSELLAEIDTNRHLSPFLDDCWGRVINEGQILSPSDIRRCYDELRRVKGKTK